MVCRVMDQFDLRQIAASGQCFRMTALPTGGWRILAGERCVHACQQGETISFYCEEQDFNHFWTHYFDLDTDYSVFLHAIDEKDEFLTAAGRYGSGLRILRQDLWETLVTFVISQNNNIPRIRAAVEKLCVRWGEQKLTPEGDVFYAFPTKQALAGAELEELRAMGLGYRDRYVQSIARAPLDFAALAELPPDKAHAALTALPGVGEKVANCVRLFGLHDLSVFPVDTWIRRMCQTYYGGRFPLERYEGFAGVIQQYIFYYGRAKDSIHK